MRPSGARESFGRIEDRCNSAGVMWATNSRPDAVHEDADKDTDVGTDAEEPGAVLHGDDGVFVADRHAELAGLPGERRQPPDLLLSVPHHRMGGEIVVRLEKLFPRF